MARQLLVSRVGNNSAKASRLLGCRRSALIARIGMVNRGMELTDRLPIGVFGLLVGLHGAILLASCAILGVSACGWIWGWFQMFLLTSLVPSLSRYMPTTHSALTWCICIVIRLA